MLFQPIHPRHIRQLYTDCCAQLLQEEHEVVLFYLLYLSRYMPHRTGKDLYLLTRTKLMFGSLLQELFDSIHFDLADNSRFSVIKTIRITPYTFNKSRKTASVHLTNTYELNKGISTIFTRSDHTRGVRCKGNQHSTPNKSIRSFTCFSARGAVYKTYQLVS